MKKENKCPNCSHDLTSHVEEGQWHRCHSIQTPDLTQCECRIYKQELFKEDFSKKCLAKKLNLKERNLSR